MASKFENFDIGRAVAKFLMLKDPKNFPVHLNTDELQPVFCIEGPNAAETWASADLVNVAMDGRATYAYTAFGPSAVGSTNAVASPLIFNGADSTPRAHWIRGLSLNLTYDAAGAIADAGKLRQLLGWLFDPTGFTRLIFVLSHAVEIKSGLPIYSFNWPEYNVPGQNTFGGFSSAKGWNGYVPPGWSFVIQMGSYSASSVFPANTTLNGQIAVSEMPDGFTYSGPT